MKEHVKLKVLMDNPLELIPGVIEGLNEAKVCFRGDLKPDEWHEIVFYLTKELEKVQHAAVDKWAEILKGN